LAEARSPVDKGPGEGGVGVGVRFIMGEVIFFGGEPNLILDGVEGRSAKRIAMSESRSGFVGLPALLHSGDAPEVFQLDGEGLVWHV